MIKELVDFSDFPVLGSEFESVQLFGGDQHGFLAGLRRGTGGMVDLASAVPCGADTGSGVSGGSFQTGRLHLAWPIMHISPLPHDCGGHHSCYLR